MIRYQFQKDYSGHRAELGLVGVRVDVGRPSYCSNPRGSDGKLHQTGAHKEMRSGRTPELEGLVTNWK